jgi:endonuclease/exonuclease/phosphatase (EEP) superfamily protein YafD
VCFSINEPQFFCQSRRMSRIASQSAILFAAVAVSVLLLLGFFGSLHPAFDSLAHFRAHLAVLAAVLALLLMATPFRLLAGSALVFAAIAFSTTSNILTLPWLSPVQAGFEAKTEDRAVYRLLQMNLLYDNPTPEKALSLIARTQPDVITLDEVSDMWAEKLDLLSSAYPYRILCPYPNGVFGVALLSRRPFAAGTQPRCFGRGALAVAMVDLGGTGVNVAAIHLGWPWPFEQSWQIGELTQPLALLGQSSLMAGDCNATPWSAAVQRVADIGGLKLMRSVGPTWLYIRLPDFLRFAGLPIDQVFSKGAVLIHSARRLEDTGSDHLPVLVEFSLRPDDGKPVDEDETATARAGAGPGAASG